MKIIYPFKSTSKTQFRFEPSKLDDWIKTKTEGKFMKHLYLKRIFYVVQLNNLKSQGGKQHFKIGVDLKPSRRFKTYYNQAGKTNNKNHCQGGNVLFICGTDVHRDDKDIVQPQHQVYRLEKLVKDDMKQYVERGTEWLFVLPEVLMKSIKSHFISVDKIGEVYTISKYNLRTSDKRYEVEKIIKRVIKKE